MSLERESYCAIRLHISESTTLKRKLATMRKRCAERVLECGFDIETLKKWWGDNAERCAICEQSDVEALALARNIFNYTGNEKQLISYHFSKTL